MANTSGLSLSARCARSACPKAKHLNRVFIFLFTYCVDVIVPGTAVTNVLSALTGLGIGLGHVELRAHWLAGSWKFENTDSVAARPQ